MRLARSACLPSRWGGRANQQAMCVLREVRRVASLSARLPLTSEDVERGGVRRSFLHRHL